MASDVAITGMGVISPVGCSAPRFWESLCTGRSGAGPVEGLGESELPRKIACQVREPLSNGDGKGRSSDAAVGRASALAVAAAEAAEADAGLRLRTVDARVATVVGTTMGETEFIEERLGAAPADWLSAEHMKRILSGKPGCIAANVCGALGIEAAAVDLYGACAAGNMALIQARRRLLDGECDIALAGGADGFSRLAFIGFMRLRVMAESVCRPFDERRDGLLVGEGAGMFVLERAADARARGARVRARMLGGGLSCESHHPTRPQPEGEGLARATSAALADAGLSAKDVDYICAHGTGTPQNDAIEVGVMNRLFPSGVPFSSIKALTGHPMGGAAALEAAACVLSIEHQTLVPTWNLERVLQPCNLCALQGSSQPARVRFAVNNSAGFGGYNSSVLLAGP